VGDKTGIDWTAVPDDANGGYKRGATWNPTTGCTHVSAGCDNCYADTLAHRLQAMGQEKYRNGFELTMHPDTLDQPLRWSKPRGIFVNSMSDLFHVGVTDEFVARVWAIMAHCPQHTFQILTKRPQRAVNFLLRPEFWPQFEEALDWVGATYGKARLPEGIRHRIEMMHMHGRHDMPLVQTVALSNVWLGTSVEQGTEEMLPRSADVRHRIEALTKAPAIVHFLSCEPLIGPVDLETYMGHIEWVITGGESGAHARPFDPQWAEDIRRVCQSYGASYFHKQNGGLRPKSTGKELFGTEYCDFPVTREFALV
jgi:protein gp37